MSALSASIDLRPRVSIKDMGRKDAGSEESNRRQSKSIRSKMVATLAVTFIFLLAMNESIHCWIIAPHLADPEQAGRLAWQARQCFLLFTVAALLLQMLMIQRIVVEPICQLKSFLGNSSIDSVDRGVKEFNQRFGHDDEISDLAKTVDQLLKRLELARRESTSASLASGRSEVAAAVIHNVGNVLTNVNSLVDTASNCVDQMRVETLHQLADRLKQYRDDHDLLAATPEYLHRLASRLEADQSEISTLLQSLDGNVRHIHDVIRDQRQHASQKVKIEQVRIRTLVNDAIDCCQARLNEDVIDVCVTGGQDIVSEMDRSLALQSMINIIANANHAMRSHRQSGRQLNIRIESSLTHVSVHFQDNGCGMDQETLTKIFDAHFTRRQNGSGLGLHFCAIAAGRYGGSIVASSDGIGLGSTLTLQFPVNCGSNSSPTSTTMQPSGFGSFNASEEKFA